MDEHIRELYEKAIRFDQGDLRYLEDYLEAEHACAKMEELIEEAYGPTIRPLLHEYAGTLYDIMEIECMHYFQEGYLAEKNERKKRVVKE